VSTSRRLLVGVLVSVLKPDRRRRTAEISGCLSSSLRAGGPRLSRRLCRLSYTDVHRRALNPIRYDTIRSGVTMGWLLRLVTGAPGLYLSGGLGVEPPAKISDPPAAIKKRKGGRLSMYLCISTVVDFSSQNFDPPNEI